MLKRIKFFQQEQGFTLVEILVAILITTLFISAAMQSIVIAAVFRVRAQEYIEATTWIQEDLENVKNQGSTYQLTFLSDNATLGTSLITVGSTNNLAVSDKLKVGTNSRTYTITNINSTELTISPTLDTNELQGSVVAAITRCKNSTLTANGLLSIEVAVADSFQIGDTLKVGSDSNTYRISGITGNTLSISSSLPLEISQLLNTQTVVVVGTPNLGFADGLRDSITGTDLTSNDNSVDISKTSNRTNQSFVLRRTTTISSKIPHNVLQIKYEVSPGTTFNSSESIASFYTEVIPNAAFQCPLY